jgi:hypothetical protein
MITTVWRHIDYGYRQARASQSQPHTVEFRPTQSYVPPKGFNAVPCNDKTTSKSAHIFDNLEGKQIWHITAPAGVSISELRNFAMDCTVTGESVLLHKGTHYGLSRTAETSDGACEVMMPQMNGYKAGRLCDTHMLRTLLLMFASQHTNRTKSSSPCGRSASAAELQASRPEHWLGSSSLHHTIYHSCTSAATKRPENAL